MEFMKTLDDITESEHFAMTVHQLPDGKWEVKALDQPHLGSIVDEERDVAVSLFDDRIFMYVHRNVDDPVMPWE
jgi:uncharacterized protein (DUF488 family)